MSTLYVFNDIDAAQADKVTDDLQQIAAILGAKGIRFEQWEADFEVTAESSPEDILEAYSGAINRLKQEGEYQTADVINMTPDHPQKNE